MPEFLNITKEESCTLIKDKPLYGKDWCRQHRGIAVIQSEIKTLCDYHIMSSIDDHFFIG